ncbi:MAG: hypothetical protein EA353_14855 [Puniceicoccaceae bacterium]|nr:MAG: hypothetical protein EA353_14855 [Puniceicoccaceae bacterium]
MYYRQLTYLILSIFASLAAQAEDRSSATNGSSNGQNFAAISFGTPLSDLAYVYRGEWVELFIPNQAFSLNYPIDSSGPLSFYQGASKEEVLRRRGTDSPVPPIASINLPESSSQTIRIVFTGGESSRLRANLLPGGEDPIPLGNYRFFNLTQNPMVGMLGTNQFELSPASYETISLDDHSETTTHIRMAIPDENGAWGRAYNRLWEIRRENVVYVFAFTNDRNQLSLRRVSENPAIRAQMQSEVER